MSLIILRRSTSCDFAEIDTKVNIRPVTEDLPANEKHWSPCTRCWHLSDAATAVLVAWAGQYRHFVEDTRA